MAAGHPRGMPSTREEPRDRISVGPCSRKQPLPFLPAADCERKEPMPGRRETLTNDRLKNSIARKRTHRATQKHAQEVAATLRHLAEVEQKEKETAETVARG